MKLKTINDLFILEGMEDATVLAGHRGLTRPVQFVNISDAPDIIDFSGENHLLLTTAYAFKDDPQKLIDLIRQMNALNCSGLVIKLKRFLIELPEEVRQLANELSFPIIDLPMDYTLGDVSYHILNFLNNHKAEQLYYALHVHNEFSDMLIKGFSLSSIVEQLGYFLKRPVLLLNHRGEKLAFGHDFRKNSMQQTQKEIIEKICENKVAAQEGTSFNIPSDLDKTIKTFPIQTQRKQPSILAIIDAQSLPYPSSQLAIEQACNVISFTLIKEQAIEENARLYKNNFFADIIEGRINSENEIVSRCNFYGLETELKTICIVCNIDPKEEEHGSMHDHEKMVSELHNSIYDLLEDELINTNIKGTLFTKERYFVMLIQFEQYTDEETAIIQALLEGTQAHVADDISLSFGISNQVQSSKNIPVAYHEAVEAINSGYDMKMETFIRFYKVREIKELLSMIPQSNLRELYENTLKTLAYPNSKEDEELLRTIQVFLDSQCEISETSRKLFIHRNTVKYRIEKTEAITELTFQDPSDSLRVRVALLIGTLLDIQHTNTQ